jgi:glutathione peroxidase-family protein
LSSSPPNTNTTGNFSKFLIKNGQPIKRYGPTDAPTAFEKDIAAALN